METVRLRIAISNNIVTEPQKREGLKRCWIILKPQLKTIADLSSYILHIFSLHNACPQGVVLSMDGFVLPPFESTTILKDKDIVRVKRRDVMAAEIAELEGRANLLELDAVEILEKEPVCTGVKLLANEEFEKESGGYKSESEEEDEHDRAENGLEEEIKSSKVERVSKKRKAENGLEEETKSPEVEKVLKKRKASKELRTSKKKKNKAASEEKAAVITNHVADGTSDEVKVHVKRKKGSKDITNSKRSSQHNENCNGTAEPSCSPSETKKVPSRSARRKKAKRQWLREHKRTLKELSQTQVLENTSKQSLETNKKTTMSEESMKKKNEVVCKDIQKKDTNSFQENHQPEEDSEGEDNVVPIVVRPGHIRFAPLSKVGEHQEMQPTEDLRESFGWNGITSKKKGQKWGRQKATPCKWNDHNNANLKADVVGNSEKETALNDSIDFDKLAPYVSLPKVGDVIAYRIIELSSSWTPELSPYQVGRISRFDSASNMVTLVPVPGYPLIAKNTDDEASDLPENYQLRDDGSLKIDFSVLLELRFVRHDNMNTGKSASARFDEDHLMEQDTGNTNGPNSGIEDPEAPPRPQDAGKNITPMEGTEARSSAQENGDDNPWEEIKHALSTKKAQLSQNDTQSKPESSNRRSYPYRPMRASALGPTMALLRAQNGL